MCVSTYTERSKDFGTTCSSLNLRYSFLPLRKRQIEIIGRRHADIEGHTDDNGYVRGFKVIRINPLTFQTIILFWREHQVSHEMYLSSPSRLTSFVFFFFPDVFFLPRLVLQASDRLRADDVRFTRVQNTFRWWDYEEYLLEIVWLDMNFEFSFIFHIFFPLKSIRRRPYRRLLGLIKTLSNSGMMYWRL